MRGDEPLCRDADARVEIAASRLTNQELIMIKELCDCPDNQMHGWDITGTVLSVYEMAISRLLNKQIIILAGYFEKGYPGYKLTPLGRMVANYVLLHNSPARHA